MHCILVLSESLLSGNQSSGCWVFFSWLLFFLFSGMKNMKMLLLKKIQYFLVLLAGPACFLAAFGLPEGVDPLVVEEDWIE